VLELVRAAGQASLRRACISRADCHELHLLRQSQSRRHHALAVGSLGPEDHSRSVLLWSLPLTPRSIQTLAPQARASPRCAQAAPSVKAGITAPHGYRPLNTDHGSTLTSWRGLSRRRSRAGVAQLPIPPSRPRFLGTPLDRPTATVDSHPSAGLAAGRRDPCARRLDPPTCAAPVKTTGDASRVSDRPPARSRSDPVTAGPGHGSFRRRLNPIMVGPGDVRSRHGAMGSSCGQIVTLSSMVPAGHSAFHQARLPQRSSANPMRLSHAARLSPCGSRADTLRRRVPWFGLVWLCR
jgi:hypothetical protein